MDATATSGFPAGSTNPQPLAPAPPPQAGPSSEPLPFTFEELGFPWPADRGMETVPLWLQNLDDLGLPVNGADDIFMPMNNGSGGWIGDWPNMPEAW